MIVLCSVICINGVNISTSSDKCHMIDNRPSSWRPRLPLVCPNELQPKGYKTSSCELITLFESYNFSERAYREQTLYAGRTGECIFTVCQYLLVCYKVICDFRCRNMLKQNSISITTGSVPKFIARHIDSRLTKRS